MDAQQAFYIKVAVSCGLKLHHTELGTWNMYSSHVVHWISTKARAKAKAKHKQREREKGNPNIFCVIDIDIDIFVIKASKPCLWGQRLNVINSNHLRICKCRYMLNWNWFLCINQYEFGSKQRVRVRDKDQMDA